MPLRRWLPYGAIALAAHLAVLLALRGPSRLPTPVPAPTVVDETTTDLDVELTPLAEVPPAIPPSSSDVAPLARTTSTAVTHATRDPREAAEPPAQPSPTAPRTSDDWTFDPRKPTDVLAPAALAQAAREARTPAEAAPEPTTRVTGVSKTGGLAEGLDAHDASIGLGRGGPVVTALEVAAASSDAADGTATFDVAIDTSGHVSVALLSATASRGTWTQVGAAARGSLDPKRIRIPPGAQGWHVVAMVDSKVQYPNGVDPKKLGTHVEASPSLALEENKHRATIEDPPIVFKRLPGITVAHAGKVCTVAFSLGLTFGPGISGGCDPSNIGAHPLRVVRSHVVSEGRL